MKQEAIYEIKGKDNNSIQIVIYSFEIIKKKSKIIKIILEEENKNKFESKIEIQDIEKDIENIEKDIILNKLKFEKNDNYFYYFVFSFKFESSKFLTLEKMCQSSFRLPATEMFNFYSNYLKNQIYEDQDSKINNDLMYYAHKKLEKKNYNYYFFADILTESFKNKNLFLKLIRLYKKEKFETKDIFINEGRMNQIKIDMNVIAERVDVLYGHTKDEKDEEALNINIRTFFFYFNYYYQKEQLNRISQIIEINNTVYDILLNNKFNNLILKKDAINELFKYTKNFADINQLFRYNNNCLELLEIIDDNKNSIIRYYNRESIKKDKLIFLNYAILPKKDDNLNEIFNKIKELISYEKKNDIFFLYFCDNMINQYYAINEKNFRNVLIIYQIAKYIKENDKVSEVIKTTDKLLDIIHYKGFNLIENNLLTNIDILNYLENDDFYKNENYQDEFFKILEYINIDDINSDFILKWKQINWESMYHNKKDVFYNIICNDLKDIKNFENLFILFEEEEKKMNYDKKLLLELLYCFERLFEKSNKNIDEKTAEVAIKLIYLSQMNSIDSSPVIKCIQKKDIFKAEVYNKLINKKNDKYSESFKQKLINRLSNNMENSKEYYPLLFIIKNSKILKNETISFLNSNYSLTKDDFFNLVEGNDLKIYKELLHNGFLEKRELTESKYLDIIKQIDNEIKNGTIEFYYINNFYSEKKENILFERLLLIAKNDKTIAYEYHQILGERMKKINNIIKDDLIYKYLNTIFPESQKNNINKLKEIRKNILDNNLIYYQTIEKDYLEIKNQFIKEAEENIKYINNAVFLNIFSYLKKNNKDENKILLESKEYINILKIIIEENSLKKIKNDDLKKFMKIINNTKKTLNELIKNINIIIHDFNIETKVDPKEISEDILLLSQSEKYLLIIDTIINFINLTNGIQTYFYSVLNIIYNNLNKSYDYNIIKLTREVFKGYKIDINGKYMEILIKLNNEKEAKDFLFNTLNKTEGILRRIKDANNDSNNTFYGFDKVILLIKNFTNSNNSKKWKDKEIISEFKNRVNDNEEIYSSFKNYFDKYIIFKDNF